MCPVCVKVNVLYIFAYICFCVKGNVYMALHNL